MFRLFVRYLVGGWILIQPSVGLLYAADAESEGRALAQKVYDRPDGKDASNRATMTLTEKGHAPRVREMYSYRFDKGAGEVWSLIRFTAPPDIDGTGTLTQDFPGDDSNQWLYLPALDRTRRIPSSRKGGRFVGSDLYYEDLQDREVAMDRHRLVAKEPIEGVMCDVLESIPVEASNSVYSKRVSWIHRQTLIPLRVDYYKKGREQPIKRLKVRRIEQVQGYWTVMDSTMLEIDTGHQTNIKVESIRYDAGLPEALFSRKMLADPAREERYRP